MNGQYIIHQGDKLSVVTCASATPLMRCVATILYEDGSYGTLTVPDFAPVNTRTPEIFPSQGGARLNGEITALSVYLPNDTTASIVQRGQVLAKVIIGDTVTSPVIAQGYVYDFGALTLGQHDDAGPGGGSGWMRYRLLKASGAAAGATVLTLATTFTFQRYYSLGWWYHASAAVANRALNLSLRKVGLSTLPTGWTGNAAVWAGTSTLTLSASEDGFFLIDKDRSVINDAGVIAVDNTSTATSPLPLEVVQDSLAEVSFTATNVDAGDVDTVVALVEEWIVF